MKQNSKFIEEENPIEIVFFKKVKIIAKLYFY